MSTTGKDENQSVTKAAGRESQASDGCNNNSSDQPVEHDEKAAVELDHGADVETSNRDNTVVTEGAINEPAGADSVPVDADQSEKELSDDSQPNNALKRTTTSASEKPYSIFTTWQKRFIILAASTGSFISPLTSNIYYPALNTIASDLHVSISQVNLTITTYMIFQGLAPTFIGGFSDIAGRRPAYIIGFMIYIGANVGLALQNEYAALMVLRCVQSVGSSGMVAMGSGVAADCVTSAERGAYIGFMSVGTVLGPSLSPILGGILSQYLGWKSIFWFLAIFGGVTFILFLVFFPETCRNVVGDGSVPPAGYNQSLISFMNQRKMTKAGHPPDYEERDALARARHVHFPNPLSTLRIIAEKETALILFYSSLVYAGYYAINTTITTQFAIIYGYNDLVLGLCFIPISAGGILATVTNGKWDPVDGNYRRHAKRLGMPLKKNRQQDITNFPIERARLEVLLPLLYFSCVIVPIYGWVLNARVSVAGPLVLLFFLGFGIMGLSKVVQILVIDITPGKPATATAAFNLVRCLLGAGMTAVVNPMINAMGNGWTFTFIALVWVVFSPMLLILLRKGPQWRKEKKEKDAKRRERKAAKREGNKDKA